MVYPFLKVFLTLWFNLLFGYPTYARSHHDWWRGPTVISIAVWYCKIKKCIGSNPQILPLFVGCVLIKFLLLPFSLRSEEKKSKVEYCEKVHSLVPLLKIMFVVKDLFFFQMGLFDLKYSVYVTQRTNYDLKSIF